MLFDTSKEFEPRIFSGGIKTCVVRWPTDEEWKRRARKTRVRREQAEAGRVQSVGVGIESASLELFSAIREVGQNGTRGFREGDKGEEFDAFEAADAIRKLEYVEKVSTEFRDGEITVRIGAMQSGSRAVFETVHRLRPPTQKEIITYRRGSMRFLQGKRDMEVEMPLDPGEKLYDATIIKAEGYVGAVPVIHKDFVAAQAIDMIEEIMEGGDPEA